MKPADFTLLIVFSLFFTWVGITSFKSGAKTDEGRVRVYKNMEMYCTPYLLDREAFWSWKEELAELPYFDRYYEILTEYGNNLINHPEKFATRKLFDVKYAFVITRKEQMDTLYADRDLLVWMIKPNGSNNYLYYQADTSFTEKYDLHIPFFSDCW